MGDCWDKVVLLTKRGVFVEPLLTDNYFLAVVFFLLAVFFFELAFFLVAGLRAVFFIVVGEDDLLFGDAFCATVFLADTALVFFEAVFLGIFLSYSVAS